MNRPLKLNKILIVGVNWLGDSLFLLPFIKTLKENYPKSYLAIMIVPRVREIYQNNPYVDEIIVYDERGKDKSFLGKLRIINHLKKKSFDAAFILKPSLTRTFICWFAKIKERIGFSNNKNNLLLTKKIKPILTNAHRIDQNLKILEELGLCIKDRIYQFQTNSKDDDTMKRILLENGINNNEDFILINAGGNWENKRWDYKKFAELSDRIIDELKLKVVISGALKDKQLVSNIQNLTKNKIISICGKTNISELASLMKMAKIVVSSDSGPMHLAASIGVKVIALFGPTSPLITGPYPLGKHIILQQNVGCKTPCYVGGCSNIRCMDAISVSEVLKNIKDAIN
ncbi:MAG: lipopolysaccharide heptosyltransferase II [Candidatus Omnitrophota bacterium]